MSQAAASVSVVMPVARVDEFTQAAIQSILDQQRVSVELILVGTADATDPDHPLSKLVKEVFAKDTRLQLIARNQPGIVGALNDGLHHATGDYIARMDADDLCTPNRIFEQLSLASAQSTPSLISACVAMFTDVGKVQLGNQRYERWLNSVTTKESIRAACFIESPLPHPTWFAHRSVWESIGEYRSGDFPEDYDYVLRAWLAGIPMVKCESTLLQWREHPERLTHTQGRAVWIAGTGRNARHWHDALEEVNVTVAGFVDLPHPNAKVQKRHKPVIRYDDLITRRGDALVITAITDAAARDKLYNWFGEHEMMIGRDVVIGG